LTPSEFDKTARLCHRWQARSLAVVRALLVDGVPISKAAASQNMTMQQANLHRKRFLDKTEQLRVRDFMDRVQPDSPTVTALKPHAQALIKLSKQGYTTAQLIDYLREHGVKSNTATVRQLLKESGK